jgi:acyl-CoA reductase-like NAD-dependent aldehyde dehydrogenase
VKYHWPEAAGARVVKSLSMSIYTRAYHWIDGKRAKPCSDGWIDLVNPSTQQHLGMIPEGSSCDVDFAVASAVKALDTWGLTSARERIELLAKFVVEMERRRSELAEIIIAEVGSPQGLALSAQVGFALNVLDSYVNILQDFDFTDHIANSLILKEPVGVVGAISPWNFPILLVMTKLAPALAAGCTVVLKPSEYTPISAYILAEILDEVGLPPGVFNIVSGYGPDVGEAISRHPLINMVSFTGSTRAGRKVFAAASGTIKRMHLELGGKSASVILPDADLEKAVRMTIDQCFFNSGQTCLAWSRMLVPANRLEEAAAISKAQADSYVVGDPTDEKTNLGPLQNKACFDRVQDYIAGAINTSAKLVTGGINRPLGIENGFFVRPTVFSGVQPHDRIAQEEVFGPVMSIMTYANEDEAVEIVNNTQFGLHGAVWAAHDERAIKFARGLRTGRIDINGGKTNLVSPFGGYKQSGFGRALGVYGLEPYLEIKSLQLPGGND